MKHIHTNDDGIHNFTKDEGETFNNENDIRNLHNFKNDRGKLILNDF